VDSNSCPCNYRSIQDLPHILFRCNLYREERKGLREACEGDLSLPILFQTKEGIEATITFIEKTKAGTQAWYKGNTENEE
jgi:hypothetical protein